MLIKDQVRPQEMLDRPPAVRQEIRMLGPLDQILALSIYQKEE
jgi:hypothetical protein